MPVVVAWAQYRRTVSEIPHRVAPWHGMPSGEQFAALLRQRANDLGVTIDVEVRAYDLAGSYGVIAEWGRAAANTLMYEVADWVDGVRVLDPKDEDVSIDEGLDYFVARIAGATAKQAVDVVRPPRKSLWRRWRRGCTEQDFYGTCDECQHDWREHAGGVFGEPADEMCGECRYEVEHDQRTSASPPCQVVAPPRR
jgi:hypothetical protein